MLTQVCVGVAHVRMVSMYVQVYVRVYVRAQIGIYYYFVIVLLYIAQPETRRRINQFVVVFIDQLVVVMVNLLVVVLFMSILYGAQNRTTLQILYHLNLLIINQFVM